MAKTSEPIVYAIGTTQHALVKIGTTTDLPGRLATLQTASPFPLEVLWRTEGGRELERHLHATLRERRLRGEWFDFKGADAVSLIASAAGKSSPPPVAKRRSVGRPRTGQIPTQTFRAPAEDWDAMRAMGDRDLSHVIREFIRWHLRKPGARLSARPSVEEIQAVNEQLAHSGAILELALTIHCPVCEVDAGPCLTGKDKKKPAETVHRSRLKAAAALYEAQRTAQ